ncbi:MAG: VOC family protein [Comamonadaceae bacterium]|nr:MAG: VOC family protein [Comamonadaceae bacterium]
MQPRISVITLGVEDLERAVSFYRDGLGLPTKGIVGKEIENGAVAFFDLQDRLKLAVWPRKSIAADTGLPISAIRGTHEFTIGHNVSSKEQVDGVLKEVVSAGARIVKPASDTSWGGYAGYFQDLDGHLWEIVFNPELLP